MHTLTLRVAMHTQKTRCPLQGGLDSAQVTHADTHGKQFQKPQMLDALRVHVLHLNLNVDPAFRA